jgi:hypothetical protein
MASRPSAVARDQVHDGGATANLPKEMAMREIDKQEQFTPLGPKVNKPADEPRPAWKPTDQPGIERNCADGKLRNVNPAPSDKALPLRVCLRF